MVVVTTLSCNVSYSGTIMDVLSMVGILYVKWMSYGFSEWVLISHLAAVINHFTMCLEMMAHKDMQLMVSQIQIVHKIHSDN